MRACSHVFVCVHACTCVSVYVQVCVYVCMLVGQMSFLMYNALIFDTAIQNTLHAHVLS